MRAPQISQFSDSSIPFNVAASLCGPAAAIAFSRVNGRNPTLQEAKALAEQVGWTPQGGMNGLQNEVALLTKMRERGDVGDFEQAPTADQGRITSDVQAGKPVIVSTGLHYFTLSDYDPQTGKFYVGTSGTDLNNGTDWMSLSDIEHASTSRGYGGINGAIHLVNAPVVSAERQRFLEANTPGESVTPEDALKDAPRRATDGETSTETPELPGSTPKRSSAATTKDDSLDPARKLLAGLQRSDAFARKLAGEINEVPGLQVPTFALSLPKVDLGWRRPRSPYTMPGAA
jgi:hypothetical protein